MSENVQRVITLDQDEILAFCGRGDAKLRRIQDRIRARLIARGNELRLSGASGDVDEAFDLISELLKVQRRSGTPLSEQQIQAASNQMAEGDGGRIQEVFLDTIPVPLKRKHVAPLTRNQKQYIDAIRRHDIVFAIGPAGTGKTFLAVAMAVSRLIAGEVNRIILTRPVVEAGERLGFLPGDIEAKVNPYVRPLYDALYEMLEAEKMRAYLDSGVIEIAPLAFMRGRTLNNSFIILDEAQNTTIEQMKMFLTRIGMDSQAVVAGDITQTDLPRDKTQGLAHARKVLGDIDGVGLVQFTRRDVVRHPLIQEIIQAYETHG